MTVNWDLVAERVARIAADRPTLDDGQRASLRWIATRLPTQGVVLADEVGTGKTRIACAVAEAVLACEGRAAVVVPRGLMHQWRREWHALGPELPLPGGGHLQPREMATFVSYVRRIADAGAHEHKERRLEQLQQAAGLQFPRTDQPDLWLLSHGLSAPRTRIGGERYERTPWQLALPTFVQGHLSPTEDPEEARTRFGQLRRQAKDLDDNGASALWVVDRMAHALTPAIRSKKELLEELEKLPPLKVRDGTDNAALAAAFQRGGSARAVFDQLLGAFLGRFDLVIIDEAHKSRGGELAAGEADEGTAKRAPRNVLTNLLENIIPPLGESRRISVTATPLELGAEQWSPLLDRTLRGSSRIDPDVMAREGKRAAAALEHSASRVRRTLNTADAPAVDERDLDQLCRAAEEMTATLRPTVTRRRRSDDPRIREFRSMLESVGFEEQAASSRPHRRIVPVSIELPAAVGTDASTLDLGASHAWSDAIFALEALAQALRTYARGRDTDEVSSDERAAQWVRTAYTRVSAGHLSTTRESALAPLLAHLPDAPDDTPRKRQLERIRYWAECHDEALERLGKTLRDDGRDPLAPLYSHPRVIHAAARIEEFTSKGEKVLVFGTFRAPMQALARVLEVRHTLRRLAQGKIVPRALGDLRSLAWLELCRLRESGWEERKSLGSSPAELEENWVSAHQKYRSFRERIERSLPKLLTELLTAKDLPPKHLTGSTWDKLRAIATPFVVDRLLYDAHPTMDSERRSASIQASLDELWERTIRPRMDALRDRSSDGGQGEEAARQLAAVLAELEEEDLSSHDTHHVRILQGDTRDTTRELLQAKFNREHSAPHVLIAQSRVGREGLNLHEACRVVFQFNAEWNPAILEQQIGRVDRTGSLWERKRQEWTTARKAGATTEDPPFIEVRQLIFNGTYDHFQWESVFARQHLFDATLYGELLPAQKIATLAPEARDRLAKAAPNFAPPGAGEVPRRW